MELRVVKEQILKVKYRYHPRLKGETQWRRYKKREEENGKLAKLSPLQGTAQGLALFCQFANCLANREGWAAYSETEECIMPSSMLAPDTYYGQ